ncbi:hypothetical protein ECEC1847_4962, partial [Escherichia coli EC1847]
MLRNPNPISHKNIPIIMGTENDNISLINESHRENKKSIKA